MKDEALQKIEHFSVQSRGLDPGPEVRHAWAQAVFEHAESFLQSLSDWPVQERSMSPAQGLLQHPPQALGVSLDQLLPLLREHLERQGLKPASGGYLAYIPGGGLYPAALGDYLAAVGNHYAGFFFGSPGGVRIENQLIRWTAEVIGYDPLQAGGNICSGGSYANLIAFHAAREAKGIRAAHISRQVIYLSQHTHQSAQKALRVIGMGEAIIRYLPLDGQYRIIAQALREQIQADRIEGLQPFMLIASAGTTDTGAIDPLAELAVIAQESGLWMHTDAAYGGYFALVPAMQAVLKGLAQSDSLTVDPHKSLFMPLGIGMVLVKDIRHLQAAYGQDQAQYLQDVRGDASEPSPADLSPELSKHFRGLRMWLPLKLFGTEAFSAALAEKIWLARYFYYCLQEKPGFELGPFPDLSVVIFRYHPSQGEADPFNQKLVAAIQAEGSLFLSSTRIEGKIWLRLAVLHFRSHLTEIETCLALLDKFVLEIRA